MAAQMSKLVCFPCVLDSRTWLAGLMRRQRMGTAMGLMTNPWDGLDMHRYLLYLPAGFTVEQGCGSRMVADRSVPA